MIQSPSLHKLSLNNFVNMDMCSVGLMEQCIHALSHTKLCGLRLQSPTIPSDTDIWSGHHDVFNVLTTEVYMYTMNGDIKYIH